jgi:hypothetical protein
VDFSVRTEFVSSVDLASTCVVLMVVISPLPPTAVTAVSPPNVLSVRRSVPVTNTEPLFNVRSPERVLSAARVVSIPKILPDVSVLPSTITESSMPVALNFSVRSLVRVREALVVTASVSVSPTA